MSYSRWISALKFLEPHVKPYEKVLEGVIESFEKNYEAANLCTFIFGFDAESPALSVQLLEGLNEWHGSAGAPSLVALCALACEKFSISSPDLVSGVLMAAVLGEVENDHPYHNNMHFKKVLLQTLRIIGVHNQIFSGTSRMLGEREMAMLLVAACIHDFGHDSLGNILKGILIPSRLERQSFELCKPYLQAAGYAEEDELRQLEALLLATDVSPLDDPTSPMRQMKAAYRFHFMGEHKRMEKLNLSEDLTVFETDSRLTQMAMILHEADIASSAGIDYVFSQYETGLFRKEMGFKEARPSHMIDFLNQVCQRQFMGDAARKLYSANMARIYALADRDMRAGDEPYPDPEKISFVSSQTDAQTGSRSVH